MQKAISKTIKTHNSSQHFKMLA